MAQFFLIQFCERELRKMERDGEEKWANTGKREFIRGKKVVKAHSI